MFPDPKPVIRHTDIEYICSLMFEVLRLPVYFLNPEGTLDLEFSYRHSRHPLSGNTQEFLIQLLSKSDITDYPVFVTSQYLENYFYIRIKNEEGILGTVIAGPSLFSRIDEQKINSLIAEFGIPMKKKVELLNYYQHIPVMDYRRFFQSGMLLYYCFYRKKLDFNSVVEKNTSVEDIDANIGQSIELNILGNSEDNFFHHTTQRDKAIIECVKNGEKDKLIRILNKPLDGQEGILAKNNPLRSHKNLFICYVTVVTRAAIEGGLDPELAFTLSDSYIQHVEELNEMKDILNLRYKMSCDFTERVSELKKQNFSKAVLNCRAYISEHLFEDITLSALAKKANLNPNYLSELFKKEAGSTISEYIQNARVEAAKNLLSHSDYSVFDICIYLNFNDQSYFTKVFRKHTGMTPKQYRNRHALK